MLNTSQISRGALLCVGLLSAAIALLQLAQSIRNSTVSTLAVGLAAEKNIEFTVLQKVAVKLQTAADISCRSDILADALTVHLHYLDRIDDVQNYDEWAQGVQRASMFVKNAIHCSPADGNLWARLAMLRQAAVYLPADIAELMKQSVKLSPAQINVLMSRLEVWRRISREEWGIMVDMVRRDVSNILCCANGGDVTSAQTRFSLLIEASARSVMDTVPLSRVNTLSHLGIRSAKRYLLQKRD